jgi:hypothetical protein
VRSRGKRRPAMSPSDEPASASSWPLPAAITPVSSVLQAMSRAIRCQPHPSGRDDFTRAAHLSGRAADAACLFACRSLLLLPDISYRYQQMPLTRKAFC